MTKSLTDLITTLQYKLIDDGTRFTTTTCTEAIREALKDWNLRAPIHAADLITVVTDQKEYEVTDIDVRAMDVLGVYIYDDTGKSDHELLDYDTYLEDERLFFRLREAQSSTEQLLVIYTIPQTINGLDSETETTLSDHYAEILAGGAKANAMQMRADSRIETINLQQQVSDNYREQVQYLRDKFMRDLQAVAMRRNALKLPQDRSWNDEYQGWPI